MENRAFCPYNSGEEGEDDSNQTIEEKIPAPQLLITPIVQQRRLPPPPPFVQQHYGSFDHLGTYYPSLLPQAYIPTTYPTNYYTGFPNAPLSSVPPPPPITFGSFSHSLQLQHNPIITHFTSAASSSSLMVNQPIPTPYEYEMVELYTKVVDQISYYFSKDNLVKDVHLRKNMDRRGWVSIQFVAGFNRMRQLTDNIPFILASLIISNIVQVRGTKIRKHGDWKKMDYTSQQCHCLISTTTLWKQ